MFQPCFSQNKQENNPLLNTNKLISLQIMLKGKGGVLYWLKDINGLVFHGFMGAVYSFLR